MISSIKKRSPFFLLFFAMAVSSVSLATCNINNVKFDFNDVVIVPEQRSKVRSRKEINVLDENGKLPIIVSGMDTVIDEHNYQFFLDQNIYVCIPRGIYNGDLTQNFGEAFLSLGLSEAEKMCDNNAFPQKRILVDVANGHSERVIDVAKKIKEKYGDTIELMMGNVANPQTYREYALLGVDWLRCGIGGGQACLTSANTGVHYPMASLVAECYQIKAQNNFKTKIVADGGFKNFDEINKALALGADAVMLGSIFNKCIEACGDNWILNKETKSYIPIHDKAFAEKLFQEGVEIYKLYRGMSTKQVQAKWGKKHLTTSEGIVKYNKVAYKLSGWLENFTDYLRSAMSYANARNLGKFIGNVQYVFISQNALSRFKK